MIKIGANTYTVGRDAPGQNYIPPQQVELAEFWIDQSEVTNAQYAAFLAETKNSPPAAWPEGQIPADQADHPVKGISWHMAEGYCQWAKKRLPREAEWEVAARGPEGRLFPWGDDPQAVELPQSGTYPVGSKPTNQSAFGVFDMAGNVWEWVGDTYAPVPDNQRVLRGGENGFLKDMAYRLSGPSDQESMTKTAGIRCAADAVNLVELDSAQVEGVLAQDSFVNPGSGWPILSEGTYLFGYHPPDYYHVEVGLPEAHTVVSRQPNFENVTVETKVLVDHTDTPTGDFRYGLALRRVAEDQYYAFTVSSRTGTWQVLKRTPANLEVLAEGPVETLQGFAPPGFTPDKTDTLRVDANGSDFVFQINGQPVIQISDNAYVSGEAGFFVETFDETLAHIHYDELIIREVEFEPVALAAPIVTPTAEIITPTLEATPTTSVSDAITTTASPSPTATTPPSPTPEPTPEIEPTATAEPPTPATAPEGMVLIPAGQFTMGSSSGAANEAPEHLISLAAFYLDLFEVSNAQYRQCVNSGGCTPGNAADSFTYPGYRDAATYDNYPVVGVNWDQAEAYCRWAGKRLPTEAEWEYAASGPENLTWPWGNTFDPNLSAASASDTQPVDSYPAGVSPFGVYNMAGNVAEWVQDVFDENFYANSPAENPVNTGSGAGRVYRGGSFGNPDGSFYTTSRRYGNAQTFSDVDIGFRCAMNGEF
jgi:formylglycine-generating enzyme required for sulfatase activity